MPGPPPDRRTVCVNRKARFDYHIEDRFEAGISLHGSEVKSLREGKGNLVDAYVLIRGRHAKLIDFEISAYSHDRTGSHQTRRTRELLLHAAEIKRLSAKMREKSLTLIPLAVYFKGPWAKVEIALAKGKRKADKRQAIRKRDAQRDIDRASRRH